MSEKKELPYSIKAVALVFLLSAALLVPTVSAIKAEGNMPFFGTEYSLNWSGYVAATSETSPTASVTGVSASWVVPTLGSPPKRGYSGTWIGIGGFFEGDGTLIQVGTAQFIERGATYYFAWYELLPAYMIQITAISVDPGDVMSASVSLFSDGQVVGPDPTDVWSIQIADDDGGTFDLQVTYYSSMLSAEWIEEAPSLGRKILPLANFGTVTFTGCYATIGGTTGPINRFGLYNEAVVMVKRARGTLIPMAIPSSLSSGGTSFTISYYAP